MRHKKILLIHVFISEIQPERIHQILILYQQMTNDVVTDKY